ncbi:MAG: hypothetical protein KDB04_14210 [Acidimicrobiales bacterium]|nr:hypothetical protein [Acidimicrobiales bacterium]HRW37889.1 hypothetical protein [Aquihabitans sp.]
MTTGTSPTRLGRATAAALAVTLLSQLGVARPADAADVWVLRATFEEAAAQPTAKGQTIDELAVFDGRIWPGFGDWGANTGPIASRPFVLATGQLEDRSYTSPSHAIETFRVFGDEMWAPDTDPLGDGAAALDPTGGIVEVSEGTWEHRVIGPSYHLFDVARTDDDTLYVAGSTALSGTAKAAIWRSTDHGETWEVLRTSKNPRISLTPRFVWIAAIGDVVYSQYGRKASDPKVFMLRYQDGQFTTPLASPFCSTGGQDGADLEVFKGHLVCGGTDAVTVYDPAANTVRRPSLKVSGHDVATVLDLYTDGDTIWALGSYWANAAWHKAILASTDGSTWTVATTTFVQARSVAYADGALWVGTVGSRLYVEA